MHDTKSTSKKKRRNKRICAMRYAAFVYEDNKPKLLTTEKYVKVEGHLISESDAEHMRLTLYEEFLNPNQTKHSTYIDRMSQWDANKFRKAISKCKQSKISVGDSIANATIGDVEDFLTEYNGYPCRLVKVCENKGYDGYYYTELVWVESSTDDNKKTGGNIADEHTKR